MTCRKIILATELVNFLASPGSGSGVLPRAGSLEDEGTENAAIRAPLLSTLTFAHHFSLRRVLFSRSRSIRHPTCSGELQSCAAPAAGDISSCSEHT